MLHTCINWSGFLSNNCGLDVMTGTTIFLLMPRSWNSSKIEFILFEEQPRIWGQLFTAIPRTSGNLKGEKVDYSWQQQKKKARQEKQINMNLRHSIEGKLFFFTYLFSVEKQQHLTVVLYHTSWKNPWILQQHPTNIVLFNASLEKSEMGSLAWLCYCQVYQSSRFQ